MDKLFISFSVTYAIATTPFKPASSTVTSVQKTLYHSIYVCHWNLLESYCYNNCSVQGNRSLLYQRVI